MEPPARPPSHLRRGPAAGRSSLAPALPALALLLLTASCGEKARPEGGVRGPQGPDLTQSSATPVAAGEEGTFDDLPGVETFAALSPELRRAVVDRANRTRCDCGCPRHSVNHCLHQDETCEVALHLAGSFVDDAMSLQLQVGGSPPAAPENQPDGEASEPAGPEEPEGGDAP